MNPSREACKKQRPYVEVTVLSEAVEEKELPSAGAIESQVLINASPDAFQNLRLWFPLPCCIVGSTYAGIEPAQIYKIKEVAGSSSR